MKKHIIFLFFLFNCIQAFSESGKEYIIINEAIDTCISSLGGLVPDGFQEYRFWGYFGYDKLYIKYTNDLQFDLFVTNNIVIGCGFFVNFSTEEEGVKFCEMLHDIFNNSWNIFKDNGQQIIYEKEGVFAVVYKKPDVLEYEFNSHPIEISTWVSFSNDGNKWL